MYICIIYQLMIIIIERVHWTRFQWNDWFFNAHNLWIKKQKIIKMAQVAVIFPMNSKKIMPSIRYTRKTHSKNNFKGNKWCGASIHAYDSFSICWLVKKFDKNWISLLRLFWSLNMYFSDENGSETKNLLKLVEWRAC